ncbi:helix-turn-helix domain-containing protein [Candidatus Microgenomates bacterium]|nr:helix-turn-helix domain-containing protein [Candidatus Microgenomates bacterium]
MAETYQRLPELLTIKQVSKILAVHMTTLRRWDKKGKLKAVRVGLRSGVGERRYRREDIIKLITSQGENR